MKGIRETTKFIKDGYTKIDFFLLKKKKSGSELLAQLTQNRFSHIYAKGSGI